MPKYIFSYIRGLIQSHKVTATALSRQFNISHDGITRMLTARFPWNFSFRFPRKIPRPCWADSAFYCEKGKRGVEVERGNFGRSG